MPPKSLPLSICIFAILGRCLPEGQTDSIKTPSRKLKSGMTRFPENFNRPHIKASATVIPTDFRGLRKFKDVAKNHFVGGVVLYDCETGASFGKSMYAVSRGCCGRQPNKSGTSQPFPISNGCGLVANFKTLVNKGWWSSYHQAMRAIQHGRHHSTIQPSTTSEIWEFRKSRDCWTYPAPAVLSIIGRHRSCLLPDRTVRFSFSNSQDNLLDKNAAKIMMGYITGEVFTFQTV